MYPILYTLHSIRKTALCALCTAERSSFCLTKQLLSGQVYFLLFTFYFLLFTFYFDNTNAPLPVLKFISWFVVVIGLIYFSELFYSFTLLLFCFTESPLSC